MKAKVIPVTRVLEDSFVYSCTFERKYSNYEQFLPYHVLSFQFSGETFIQHQSGKLTLKKNQLLLTQKNQLAKSIKIPGTDKVYKSISIILTDAAVRQYAADNAICENKWYTGQKILLLNPGELLRGYFKSLLPYVTNSKKVSKKLVAIKINEAIELLLDLKPTLKSFLFDFSEPYKIDLGKFMLQNYHYNVPIGHFAKLTGRSLPAFKRDFSQTFHTSPRKWLQGKRLTEAYHLIKQTKRKPTEIYLEVGFENLSHFYTSFKRKFGVTPGSIKRKKIF
jgi:AraC-like DNA-binding protein